MTNITVTEREGVLVVDSRIITIRTYETEISELGVFAFETEKPPEGSSSFTSTRTKPPLLPPSAATPSRL